MEGRGRKNKAGTFSGGGERRNEVEKIFFGMYRPIAYANGKMGEGKKMGRGRRWGGGEEL